MDIKNNVSVIRGILNLVKQEERNLREQEIIQIQRCLNNILIENANMMKNEDITENSVLKYEHFIKQLQSLMTSVHNSPDMLDFVLIGMENLIEKIDHELLLR